MKYAKKVTLVMLVILSLGLVPAVSAEDELGTVFGATSWLVECGADTFNGIPVGMARVNVTDRIPPEFFDVNSFSAYSPQYGSLESVTTTVYNYFLDDAGYWWFVVPADGYSTLVIEVFDSGGGLHTTSSVTADCTTGEIHVAQGSVYGPKVPKGFELRSLSCSSAVLDVPGGEQVKDNAVYAGQTWFVNPVSDGGYTEIFVGGWKTGYIPTECVGGVVAFSAE